MKFKYVAGTSIVPTLSRLVLGAAFLTAGYSKLFVTVPYNAAQVEALDGLGVDVTPIGGEAAEDMAARSGVRIVMASLIQEEPAPEPVPDPEPPTEEEPTPTEPADEPTPAEPTEEPPPAEPSTEPAPPADETPPTLDADESELLESLKQSVREAADEAKRKADALAERKREQDPAEPTTTASPPPVELGNETEEDPPATQPADETPSEPDTPADAGGDVDDPEPVEDDTAETETPADAGPPAGTAKELHRITLLVHNDARLSKLPHSIVASSGQVAAWTEFIGGALLLVGFLSRVWGLGLAFAMGVAFYLTSADAYWNGVGPFGLAQDLSGNLGLFNRMFAQLGLGLLALGIFLTGPGPLSLDRLLFGRRGGRRGSVVVDEDD